MASVTGAGSEGYEELSSVEKGGYDSVFQSNGKTFRWRSLEAITLNGRKRGSKEGRYQGQGTVSNRQDAWV